MSRFTEGFCRYTLRGVIALPSAIFCPGKVVPNILFLLLLFVFHDLCFLFSAMSSSVSLSLSGFLRLSCRQCCRLKFFSSWLLMLKVGIQWETDRRKNTASFITLVVFYVSLVKINSGKLEARDSCSLLKHVPLLKENIQGFHSEPSQNQCMFYLIVERKISSECQYAPSYHH